MRNSQQNQPINFLTAKISNMQAAIFKSEMNNELQLPNNVINILKVEDEGYLWFYTSCKTNYTDNISKVFYAYLDFHKKGSDCRLQVSGKAEIVQPLGYPVEHAAFSSGVSKNMVLVKMKMMQATYFETSIPQEVSFIEKLKSWYNYLFLEAEPKTFHFM